MNAFGAAGTARARLTRLSITDFRNIARAEFEFPEDGIAVVGDNGQGKTNLLEAVAYLELARSIRNARDRDLIRFGAETFHIAAEAEGTAVRRVGMGASRSGEKRASLDGADAPRLTDALGAIPSVCVSPADVALIAGGPAERRRAMDIVLALTDRGYLSALRAYRAALARRNAVLRGPRRARTLDSLGAWEPALATSGATLIRGRGAWVEEFGGRFAELAAAIGEAEPIRMTYASPFAGSSGLEDQLAAALEASREQDALRGSTQVGPHRDDLTITLGSRSLRLTGSAGQHRTAAIALRLLEAETFRSRARRQPILLLDDPFAELDRRRAARVLALLEDTTTGGVGQILLCVPRLDEIPPEFTRLERWTVRGGVFARQSHG